MLTKSAGWAAKTAQERDRAALLKAAPLAAAPSVSVRRVLPIAALATADDQVSDSIAMVGAAENATFPDSISVLRTRACSRNSRIRG